MRKNDIADGLYCLLSGKIRISNVNQEGKEMVLTWLESGTWFGEISLFDGLPRTHDAFAELETSLLVLPAAEFHTLLGQHPDLYPHFMKLLCQRIRATFSLLDESGGLTLKGQLSKRLLLLANGLGQSDSVEPGKEINASQESLAHMLNSSRQTVNKLLQELQSEGTLSVHYGKIVLQDIERLSQLSEI